MGKAILTKVFILQRFQTATEAKEMRETFQKFIDLNLKPEENEMFKGCVEKIKDNSWTFHGAKLTINKMEEMIQNIMLREGGSYRIIKSEIPVSSESGYVAPGYDYPVFEVVKEFINTNSKIEKE